MAQTRRSTARGLEQVPSRRLSAVPAEEAASEAARRGKRRGRIKYRIFTLGLGLDMTMLFLILVLLAVGAGLPVPVLAFLVGLVFALSWCLLSFVLVVVG